MMIIKIQKTRKQIIKIDTKMIKPIKNYIMIVVYIWGYNILKI